MTVHASSSGPICHHVTTVTRDSSSHWDWKVQEDDVCWFIAKGEVSLSACIKLELSTANPDPLLNPQLPMTSTQAASAWTKTKAWSNSNKI